MHKMARYGPYYPVPWGCTMNMWMRSHRISERVLAIWGYNNGGVELRPSSDSPSGGIEPWPVMAFRTPASVLELLKGLLFKVPVCLVVRRSLSEVHLIYRCGTANNRCFSGVLAQPSGEMSVNSRTSKEASRRTKTSAPFLCAVVDSVFVVGTVRLVGFRILKCDLEKPSHRSLEEGFRDATDR
ncbi:hypothetical protein AVEN_111045-1, partial [Araneus ventricosus]